VGKREEKRLRKTILVYKKIKFFTQSFEAGCSARQTALELYKVFGKYIFWSCILAEDKHKI